MNGRKIINLDSKGKLRIVWPGNALVAVLLVFLGFELINTRSVSIPLGDTGVRLTYSITWGLGMEQQLRIESSWLSMFHTKREDVWKRPYNAGGPIYRSHDGRLYFVRLRYGLYQIDTQNLSIKKYCTLDDAVTLDYFGRFELLGVERLGRGKDVAFIPSTGIAPKELQRSGYCG